MNCEHNPNGICNLCSEAMAVENHNLKIWKRAAEEMLAEGAQKIEELLRLKVEMIEEIERLKHERNKAGMVERSNAAPQFAALRKIITNLKADREQLRAAAQRALDSFCGTRPADTAPASQAEYDQLKAVIDKCT